uniref:NADH dehydrogenase subunit 6 n=1 Tax=Aegialites californicus TaxID=3056834 RepID=UPI00286A466F|nr:NADH dehydrogenase subunit 6 [Aegialites californicus]WKT09009.1 NADH dehydrogenase subunit 6 [Aegialites californicus]
MLLMLILNLTLSLIFLTLTHPLSMGLILLIQTILISMITSNFFMNFWFSYILFLILIGGMLILFIYMTSVASNEKFYFNNKTMMMMLILLFLLLIMPSFTNYYFNINLYNSEYMQLMSNCNLNFKMNKFFSYPLNIMLLFIMIYLFLTLIAVVKITNLSYGPLRQKN